MFGLAIELHNWCKNIALDSSARCAHCSNCIHHWHTLTRALDCFNIRCWSIPSKRLRTHTHEVYAFILCLKESPRIRIYRFGLKIAYFAQEFYEMCFVPGFELNLIWRFVRQPKFQMQCQMIYLKTLPQLQRIAYFTPLALWWWRQQQQQHWCLLQTSRIHVVDTQHTNNQCVQTHLNA